MISARTREKWIMKLRTIQEAVEYNSMQQQSITLNRIYGRVGS